MIQKITEDDEGNTVLELDEEGIDYLMNGLMALSEAPIGMIMTTPAVWTNSSPWWRFWNRKGEPVVGEFQLKRVA